MPGLMGQHAEQLIGGSGPQDQAGVHAHDPATGGEGVQIVLVDKQDLDLGRFQPHGDEDRVGPLMNDALDLGVPDRALSRGGGRRRQHEAHGGDDARCAEGGAG